MCSKFICIRILSLILIYTDFQTQVYLCSIQYYISILTSATFLFKRNVPRNRYANSIHIYDKVICQYRDCQWWKIYLNMPVYNNKWTLYINMGVILNKSYKMFSPWVPFWQDSHDDLYSSRNIQEPTYPNPALFLGACPSLSRASDIPGLLLPSPLPSTQPCCCITFLPIAYKKIKITFSSYYIYHYNSNHQTSMHSVIMMI